MFKLMLAALVTLTAQTMLVTRLKRASWKLDADGVKRAGWTTGTDRVRRTARKTGTDCVKRTDRTTDADCVRRTGWRMGVDRVKRATQRMFVVPVDRVARGMFLLPAGLIGQVSGSPSAPPSGAGLMQDALNWAMWAGLILSALAAAGGAGTIGVSRISGQVNHSNTGKQVLMGGLFGAAGVGLAIPVVNMLFSAAGK